jgi:hypothetical protein
LAYEKCLDLTLEFDSLDNSEVGSMRFFMQRMCLEERVLHEADYYGIAKDKVTRNDCLLVKELLNRSGIPYTETDEDVPFRTITLAGPSRTGVYFRFLFDREPCECKLTEYGFMNAPNRKMRAWRTSESVSDNPDWLPENESRQMIEDV